MTKPRAIAAAVVLALIAGCTGLGGRKGLPDAQAVIAGLRFPKSSLKIAAEVDRPDRTYRSGEEIRFSVRLDRPASLAVLEVEKDGGTRLLFPNRAHPSASVAAKRRVAIPGSRDDFAIRAPAPGRVLYEVLASTDGSSWLFHRSPAGAALFADLGATTHLLAKEILTTLKRNGGAAAASPIILRVKSD